jgi:hypothetical protein
LVDNYLSIYPDKEQYLLWEAEPVAFYVSPAVVKPRSTRYSAANNPVSPTTAILRSYSAISVWGDAAFPVAKTNAMNYIFADSSYMVDTNSAANVWQRSQADGSVFRVSILTKLLMLGIIKFSTLDPYGMGIEMEGGKPGWNDAMNGLPGLLGSGMPETYEMLRIIRYGKSVFTRFSEKSIDFPVEFVDFMNSIQGTLDTYLASSQQQTYDFTLWDTMNTARETYRAATVATFSGKTTTLDAAFMKGLFEDMEERTQIGMKKALGTTENGLSPTYFFYDCTDYTITTDGFQTSISPKSFELRTLPFFLEGPTRQLKILTDINDRRDVYQKVKASPLYDSALKMFMICEKFSINGTRSGKNESFLSWMVRKPIDLVTYEL